MTRGMICHALWVGKQKMLHQKHEKSCVKKYFASFLIIVITK
ncbi:hypothetical protein BTN50_1442 [Candidatus Enterovibrio altilux]|uniref:Uncharacterized protein n=1 Tax=Candidatus Enterovibrio altilux TaxID=1927128 RepID=A0A291BA69_9GAMM|nr:hypothetical protein BTN50_1442 [Candidatus Enterovibrio luxaltus]